MSKKKKSGTLQKCKGGITMGELFTQRQELIGKMLTPRDGDYAQGTVLSDFNPKRLVMGTNYMINKIFQYTDTSYVMELGVEGEEESYSVVGPNDYMSGMDLV